MPDSSNDYVAITGLAISIKRMTAVGQGAPKYLHDVLLRCLMTDFMAKFLEQTSLQDHSLEELAALDHPYSVRYSTNSFVHPDSYIHEQTGAFLESIHVDDSGTAVKLVTNSPYYVYLRYGTSVMRIRDPATAAINAAMPLIQRRIQEEVKGAIFNIMKQS